MGQCRTWFGRNDSAERVGQVCWCYTSSIEVPGAYEPEARVLKLRDSAFVRRQWPENRCNCGTRRANRVAAIIFRIRRTILEDSFGKWSGWPKAMGGSAIDVPPGRPIERCATTESPGKHGPRDPPAAFGRPDDFPNMRARMASELRKNHRGYPSSRQWSATSKSASEGNETVDVFPQLRAATALPSLALRVSMSTRDASYSPRWSAWEG